MRDTAHDKKFDEKYWKEHHGPDILPPKDAEILNHHGCTIGIARLVTDKAGPSIYLPGQDPFDKTWDQFAPPSPDLPEPPYPESKVWNGSVSDILKDFETNFQQYSGETEKWEPVPIDDVQVEQGAECKEAKMYEPQQPRVRYYSVRITKFETYRSARRYLMGCATFAILTSTATTSKLVKKDIESTDPARPGKVFQLQFGLQFFLCYNNILVEINGRADQDKVQRVVDAIVVKIREPGMR